MGLKVRYEWCICTWACMRVLPCKYQLMDGHVAVTVGCLVSCSVQEVETLAT